jgi:DsbC/DsbD-like thiol-disulfide interchange protein
MRPSTLLAGITLGATLMPAAGPARPVTVETPQSPRLVQAPQGTIELIVSSARVLASGDIDAALRFRLQDGWHIYWRNPGDSGGPPTLRWSLPAGVTAGEIAWPTPKRIPAGPLVNYGYDGDVVLPVSLRVTLAARSRPLAIGVDVRWLVCKDICVPVRSSLAMTLPLEGNVATSAADWARQIHHARSLVPVAAPAHWRANVTRAAGDFVLSVDTDGVVKSPMFFPLRESQIEDAAPHRAEIDGSRVRLRLARSAQLTAEPDVLHGVLTVGDGRGYVNPGCPFTQKHYGSGNMPRLQREWTAKGVVWLTVSTSAPAEKADAYAKVANGAATAILMDLKATTAMAYTAKTSPHMFVIDPKGALVYNGAIDDKPTPDPADVVGAKNFVAAALTEGVAGRPITTPTSRPYGCVVKYPSAGSAQ